MKKLGPVQELKRELIQNYEKWVRAVAKATRTPREDAREVLHRAIVRMFARLRERPRGSRIVAWQPYLVRAGINALLDEQREEDRDVRLSELYDDEEERLRELPDPAPRPERRLDESETRAILWGEVKRLSPREAEVVKRWAHGSSFQEIARALGIRPSTVRELCSRGVRHLRKSPRIRALVA